MTWRKKKTLEALHSPPLSDVRPIGATWHGGLRHKFDRRRRWRWVCRRRLAREWGSGINGRAEHVNASPPINWRCELSRRSSSTASPGPSRRATPPSSRTARMTPFLSFSSLLFSSLLFSLSLSLILLLISLYLRFCDFSGDFSPAKNSSRTQILHDETTHTMSRYFSPLFTPFERLTSPFQARFKSLFLCYYYEFSKRDIYCIINYLIYSNI